MQWKHILHGMEQVHLLACEVRVVEGKVRKYYRLTATGRTALREGKKKARELMKELE